MPRFAFNPNDLHRLHRLVFLPRGGNLEEAAGGHRNRRTGEGTEFLDFRPYTAGDDVRRVDWPLYGRLRQLFVRQHEAPRQLSVTLAVDVSTSMTFGGPVTKLEQAQRLTCALSFVALRGGDRVSVTAFADGPRGLIGPVSGVRGLNAVVSFLDRVEARGRSDVAAVVRHLHAQRRHRGLFVILSDFLNVAECEEAVARLLSRGGRVMGVQVLDPLDLGAGLSGVVRLRDSETGREVDVKIDAHSRARYAAAFEARRAQLEASFTRRGQRYVLARTSDNYLELVCDALRRSG